MYINGKGKIGLLSSDERYNINILMADIFDTNNCFKAMIMIDFLDHIEDGTGGDIEVQLMELISGCDYFECNNIDFGKIFNIQMSNVYFDADYSSGGILRVYICQEDENNTKVSIVSNIE